jgi:voltage-gated potassium channel
VERGSADEGERPSRRATASRSTLHAPRSRVAERGEPLGWRIGGPLLALGAVLAVGTFGYVTIEGWPVVDALYMTVMTVSTVGFREVHPLSVAGEFFTMALILLGVGALFYAFGSVMAFVFEGHLTQRWEWRRMERRVARLDGHIVLCGYGRVGRAIALDLARGRAALVVIDVNQSSLDEAARDGLAIVYGNAADDAVLREAGIERAAALIAATDDDADNIFVTLSARALRADLPIVARANHDDTADKLRRAGASHVVSPYAMAGQQMALLATRPSAVDFVETLLRGADADLLLEDVQVAAGAPLAGLGVAEVRSRFASGATLLALRRGGRMLAPPPVDAVLQPGDILVVAGTDRQLRAVEAACTPP